MVRPAGIRGLFTAPKTVFNYGALPCSEEDFLQKTRKGGDGCSRKAHVFQNGDTYQGEWKNGKQQGCGVCIYFNGDKYEGEWNEGLREGQGVYTFSIGDKYVGSWHEGLREGLGTYTTLSGYKYEGGWEKNRQQGYGRCIYSNGDKYEGEWNEGLREGLGTYTAYNGRMYKGLWKADFFGILGDPHMYLDKKRMPAIDRNEENSFLQKKNAVILQANYDKKNAFGSFETSHVPPAKMLESLGYATEIIRFDTSQELGEKIQKISRKIDFVWVRAHGKPSALQCGEEDFAEIEVIRHLFEKVSQEPLIWIEACLTARKGGLAEQMRKEMCRLKINPTIIASAEEVAFRALNYDALRKGYLAGVLITPFSKGFKDVSKVFRC